MYVCDRCGQEFTEVPFQIIIKLNGFTIEQDVLCENCHQLIKEILQDEGIK